jgi:hypothetical protein
LGLRFATAVCGVVCFWGAVAAGCGGSSPSPSATLTGPCMAGMTATAVLAGMGATCQSCVQSGCSKQLATCTSDCACNTNQGSAVACLGTLTPAATADAITTCVSGLGGSTNTPLMDLGTCLSTCIGACTGAAASDGGSTDAGPLPDGGVVMPSADAGNAPKPDAMSKLDAATEVRPDAPVQSKPDAGVDVTEAPLQPPADAQSPDMTDIETGTPDAPVAPGPDAADTESGAPDGTGND